LQLNHDRYAEEVAQGLNDKKKSKGKTTKKKKSLRGDNEAEKIRGCRIAAFRDRKNEVILFVSPHQTKICCPHFIKAVYKLNYPQLNL
jgi:hypothetical protein